jgi:hypothetical protein
MEIRSTGRQTLHEDASGPRSARTHAARQTPFVAGIVQTVCGGAVILACGRDRIDPLQGVAVVESLRRSGSCWSRFSRHCQGGFCWGNGCDVPLWQRVLAPVLASLAPFLCLRQLIVHVELLSRRKSVWSELVSRATLGVGGAGGGFCSLAQERASNAVSQAGTVACGSMNGTLGQTC